MGLTPGERVSRVGPGPSPEFPTCRSVVRSRNPHVDQDLQPMLMSVVLRPFAGNTGLIPHLILAWRKVAEVTSAVV